MRSFLGLVLICVGSLAFAGQSRISADALQTELNRQFPINKDLVLAQLQFSQPDLRLPEQGSRAGLALNLAVSTPTQAIRGELLVAGALAYQPANRSFVLLQPQLVQLSLPGLPLSYQQPVRELILSLLKQPLPAAQVAQQLRDPQLVQVLKAGRLTSAAFNQGELQLDWQ